MRSSLRFIVLPTLVVCASCAAEGPDGEVDGADTSLTTGDSPGSGGDPQFGLPGSSGGTESQNTGGLPSSGGGFSSGGLASGGGAAGSGGITNGSTGGSGGMSNSGGSPSGGGTSSGGASSGGASSGGASSGGTSSGGASSGGTSSGGGSGALDCNAAMPTSGAQQHSGNGRGGTGNLAWEIWSNTGNGELTTYGVPAFRASWNNAGGYLGRMGYEWGGFGDTPKPYEEHGTITAQMVSQRSNTATAGGYSYIGMYGWSTDPCVEWYVVDDSFNTMPINPGNTTNEGEVDIDGGTYIMYTRPTTGSGGTRCSGETNWIQYYSVRKTARRCGQISLTEHFDAWKDLNMPLGDLLEAKIIVEVGGGVGSVDFPIANVIESP